MRSKQKLFLCALLFSGSQLFAQQVPAVNRFTLQDAVSYGLKNNPGLQNSQLDVQIAKKQAAEIRAIGLPQINASGQFNYNAQIAVQPIPDFITPTIVGTLINTGVLPPTTPIPPANVLPLQFGVPYSIQGNITASQLIFDGTYIVGLKAAKEFSLLSKEIYAKSETDLKVNVTKAYYLALITQEGLSIIAANRVSLEKTLAETKEFYKNGFVEKLDVDRLELAVSNLQIQEEKLTDQSKTTRNMLKLQMGMPISDSLELVDKLENLSSSLVAAEAKVNAENRVEYRLLNKQLAMNKLDLRRYHYGYMPSVAAFAQHGQSSFAQKDQFDQLGKKFYPSTVLGLQVQVPIFDGLKKSAQSQQARLKLHKTENDIRNIENYIQLDAQNSLTTYQRALEQLDQQKKNLALGEDIFRRSQIKFKEGVGSSFELVDAEQQLKMAQQNYLSSLYDLLVAKMELDRALGNIK